MTTRIVEISKFLYDILPEQQKERYRLLRASVMDSIKEVKDAEELLNEQKKEMQSDPEYPHRQLYENLPANYYQIVRDFEEKNTRYQAAMKIYQRCNRELYAEKVAFGLYKKALKTIFEPELKIDEDHVESGDDTNDP